jgi:hypothetical protein
LATAVGNPIVAVFTAAVKLAQKLVAKAGEPRSWRMQLSELQTGFGVVVGAVEVEDFVELVVLVEEVLESVEDWEGDDEDCVLEVEARVEEDEMGVCETQRTWPMARSQFESSVGFQAYSWADVIPKLVSIK